MWVLGYACVRARVNVCAFARVNVYVVCARARERVCSVRPRVCTCTSCVRERVKVYAVCVRAFERVCRVCA